MQKWCDCWQQEHGPAVKRVMDHHLSEYDEVRVFFEGFMLERRQLRKLSDATMADERTRFYNHVIPFIVGQHGLKDVRTWYTVTPKMGPHLLSAGILKTEQVKKCLSLLSRFSKYLTMNGILPHPWLMVLPTDGDKSTLLETSLSPADVFNFVRSNAKPELQLMALLGSFGSLRPGETFALHREDFLTGDDATGKSKTYERLKKVGLGSRLAVHISKALNRYSEFRLPKTHFSYGYVSIWDGEAAKMIAAILRDMPSGRLFAMTRRTLFRHWQEQVEPVLKVSLHDLRRASGLYLGRVIDIPVQLLQEQMRHARITTTELYMRRPVEERGAVGAQDFDDVI